MPGINHSHSRRATGPVSGSQKVTLTEKIDTLKRRERLQEEVYDTWYFIVFFFSKRQSLKYYMIPCSQLFSLNI